MSRALSLSELLHSEDGIKETQDVTSKIISEAPNEENNQNTNPDMINTELDSENEEKNNFVLPSYDSFVNTRGARKQLTSEKYERPSIRRAQQFRRSTHPHRIRDDNQPTGYRLLDIGDMDEDAEKYHFCTPAHYLEEFGVGISLYFKTIKLVSFALLVCFFLSLIATIPVQQHVNPKESDIEELEKLHPNMSFIATPIWLYGSVYGSSRESLKLNRQIAADLTCLSFLLFLCLLAFFLEKYTVNKIDEDLMTTRDYAVVVTNPPAGVLEPSTYWEYFSRFGEVVCITIAKKNGDILHTYLEMLRVEKKMYRHLAKKSHVLEDEGGKAVDIDELIERETQLPLWKIRLQEFGFYHDLRYYVNKVRKMKQKIKDITSSSRICAPWQVFCIFNSEKDRANCIAKTQLNFLNIFSSQPRPEMLLRDKYLLSINRPDEPSVIFYEHSHLSLWYRCFRIMLSSAICGFFLYISGIFIQLLLSVKQNAQGSNTITFRSYGAAIFISVVNAGLPRLCVIITDIVETHFSNTDRERSIFIKLTIVRCINSAILYFLAVQYDDQFQISNLEQIEFILIGDSVFGAFFKFLNLPDKFIRYVLSPMKSDTQEEMNAMWLGPPWSLAERYTDLLKSVFTCLFFSSIVPSSYIIIAIGTCLKYAFDKFSLYSIWRRSAVNENEVNSIYARYFIFLAIWAHIVMAKYFYANWPFGGLGGELDTGEKISCDLFLCPRSSAMSTEQKRAIYIYEILSILCFLVFFISIFFDSIISLLQRFHIIEQTQVCNNPDDPDLNHPPTLFRDIFAHVYVPHMHPDDMLQPVLFADVKHIPSQHVPTLHGTEEELDPQSLSIVSLDNFPHLNTIEELKTIFCRIKFDTGKAVTGNITSLDSMYNQNNTKITSAGRHNNWKKSLANNSHEDLSTLQNESSQNLQDASAASTMKTAHRESITNTFSSFSKKKARRASSNSVKSRRSSVFPGRAVLIERPNRMTLMVNHSRGGAFKVVNKKEILPKGWEKSFCEGGVFYIDHTHRKTQWEKPHNHKIVV